MTTTLGMRTGETPQRYGVVVSAWVPIELDILLAMRVKETGLDKSEVIRNAIAQALTLRATPPAALSSTRPEIACRVYTPEEAAAYLKLGQDGKSSGADRLKRLAKRGQIRYGLACGEIRFTDEDLEQYIAGSKHGCSKESPPKGEPPTQSPSPRGARVKLRFTRR